MEWKSVAVVCSLIAAAVALVLFGNGDAKTGALAAFSALVAGLMPAMFRRDPPDPPPPAGKGPEIPPPPKPPSVLSRLWIAAVIASLTGCASLAAEKAAAESTYLSQQLKCIDDNQTKRDIDACRAAVKEQWARADAATGSDGAR